MIAALVPILFHPGSEETSEKAAHSCRSLESLRGPFPLLRGLCANPAATRERFVLHKSGPRCGQARPGATPKGLPKPSPRPTASETSKGSYRSSRHRCVQFNLVRKSRKRQRKLDGSSEVRAEWWAMEEARPAFQAGGMGGDGVVPRHRPAASALGWVLAARWAAADHKFRMRLCFL